VETTKAVQACDCLKLCYY